MLPVSGNVTRAGKYLQGGAYGAEKRRASVPWNELLHELTFL